MKNNSSGQKQVVVLSEKLLTEMMEDFFAEKEMIPNCLSEEKLNEMLLTFEEESSI